MRKYVLTGGPGTGKTTLLERLATEGFATVPESARQVIRKQQPDGALPWTDPGAFQELVLQGQEEAERSLEGEVFLDRGFADGIAYTEVLGCGIDSRVYDLIRAADYTRVFFLEQLPSFDQDAERREDRNLAERIHAKLYEVYDRLGCDIVRVPPGTVDERTRLVLSSLVRETGREIEGKYPTDLAAMRERLRPYCVDLVSVDSETNTIHDLFGLLRHLGYTLRVRESGSCTLTIKGQNTSERLSVRSEREWEIPRSLCHTLRLLPQIGSYEKTRETYIPLGDQGCRICLDTVKGQGFVEIEARSEHQVLLWKERLGITAHAIREPYWRL